MKKKPKLPMKRAFWLKNLFLIACLLLAATPGFSQNKTVTGTVTDATGEPLIGASVLQQGTSNGVITDIDGKYSIQVPPEATLEFSYVGMVKQAVKVGNRSIVDVQMHDDSQMLAETVVIGYGSAKKRDLTGSITNIKGDEIANKPVVNPVAALQGKIAGVQVINSGKAGADPEIRVRGTNSINGYKPLYVVDGLFNDNINFLNPQDIESMEILKDPSSLAIFGVRGANGVIIITHIHMHPDDAARFGVHDGQSVSIETDGLRGGVYRNVLIRVTPESALECHVDTEEANAMGIGCSAAVTLIK